MQDTDNDKDLFKSAVGDIKPVKHDKVVLKKSPEKTKKQAQTLRENATTHDASTVQPHLSEFHLDRSISSESYLFYAIPGTNLTTVQKLKRGDYQYDGVLDMHGLTIEDARKELFDFIEEAYTQGIKCVKVIHGKARDDQDNFPILKAHTHQWLPQIPNVVAYSSAKSKDGGSGAIYVLIKTKRD